MIPSQMLKGILQGSILAIIAKEETYGYEISQSLLRYGFGTISEGTIYPLLLRLEKSGFVSARYRDSGIGPKRKYYRLTPKGKEELKTFQSSFFEMKKAVESLPGFEREDFYERKDERTSQGE
ncbi:MAG: PadR family transcriptional regulator [Evtepia sp.]|uniref:PadR family transcriptional regulator n=1 Tax=Evtepia sp. TaxID=2773933 RepID=UPI002A74BB5D|nr:PadR family transcriptional regulator [Evtepia sp.]MDY3013792.1 PadR family transcriptional regulator [Evtepia sp.]